jgi:DNA-binding protein HU-beta
MAKKVTEAKPAPKAKAPAKAPAKAAGKAPPAPVKAAPPTTVTLKHLAAGLVERSEMGKKEADTLVNGVFSQLVDHLKAGERVRIGGLGIIEVKDRPARMGRNPATGEAIQIKASKKIAFRAAKELKDAI